MNSLKDMILRCLWSLWSFGQNEKKKKLLLCIDKSCLNMAIYKHMMLCNRSIKQHTHIIIHYFFIFLHDFCVFVCLTGIDALVIICTINEQFDIELQSFLIYMNIPFISSAKKTSYYQEFEINMRALPTYHQYF